MNEAVERAIAAVGGSDSELARLVGVSRQFVFEWKTGARKVPATRAVEIETVTGGRVTREELRPDVNWKVLSRPRKRHRAVAGAAA